MAVQVGDRGTALTPLRPQGSVRIAGDRHDARSERGYIEAGAEIVVVRGDNMGLVVRQVEVGERTDLPSHGLPAYRSFGERVAAEGERDEAERAQWESARWRYGLAIGGLLGAIAAGVGVALRWEQIGGHSITPGAIAAAAVAGGAVWGVCVFRGLDSALRGLGGDYWRFTTASTGLGLAGGTTAVVFAAPAVGLASTVLLALATTFVAAVIPPGVGLLVEWVTGGNPS